MANDEGRKAVDEILQALIAQILRIYDGARMGIRLTVKKFLSDFKVKDEAMRKKVAMGKMTQAAYLQWRYNQFLTAKRWREMFGKLTKDFVNADKLAMEIVNDSMIEAFGIGLNYSVFTADKATKGGVTAEGSFTLYNKEAVKNLIKNNPQLLPAPSVDIPKDERWNMQKISSVVTQSLLQGVTVDDLAEKLQQVTNMDETAAIRNARTMITNAENAGRYEAYKRLEKMGVFVKMQWIATKDERTRAAHAYLGGKTAPVGGTFTIPTNHDPHNKTGEPRSIRYPGDPLAAPDLVYNCRCRLVSIIDHERTAAESFGPKGLTGVTRMSFEEWQKFQKEREAKKHG